MKKKLAMTLLLALVVVGIASATLVEYFGQRETTIDVELPIEVSGNPTNELNAFGCGQAEGTPMGVLNKADFPIDVNITSSEEEGIETTYKGTLELTQKDVDFGNEGPWDPLENGNIATIEYTITGDTFSVEVIGEQIVGYELIYYKDNSERFDNPAEAISVNAVTGNLPYEFDGNRVEYDYCATNEYDTCHGAKIWYVPSDAITNGQIDWGRASEFLFETELIQYNQEGIITSYPGDTLDIIPVFDLDCMLQGTVSITTTVGMA